MDFSDNMMYYINCGVPTLMLYTQSYNNVIEIQGDGRVLGFVPDISKYAKVKKIKLNPGDVIFACTDGLIESQSLRGESYGKARLQKSIMDNLSYSSNKQINSDPNNVFENTSDRRGSFQYSYSPYFPALKPFTKLKFFCILIYFCKGV